MIMAILKLSKCFFIFFCYYTTIIAKFMEREMNTAVEELSHCLVLFDIVFTISY